MKNYWSLFSAYILVWGIFMAYYVTVAHRVARLEAEIRRLKESLRL